MVALSLDLHLSVSDGFVLSKILDKHNEFDFDKINFLCFLDKTFPVQPLQS